MSMPRKPFNPDDVAGAPLADADGLSVSDVARMVRSAVTQRLPAKLRVVGEVSNFSQRSHWFFSLKDEEAALRCVCFASAARRVRFRMADGMRVVVTGRVDYFEPQGQVQLYVDAIEPAGVGELELRFRALCDELRERGYFDIDRKQPLPTTPRCIAVVTSAKSAALQDVINTAAKRWRGCRLLLFDVAVQGASAAPQIARALKLLSAQGRKMCIDAIILTRGGGSIEDLWAFNERVVADAVFQCKLPIVAAIGHETDTTVAELVADMRCATPTQAAMQLVPDQAAMQHQIHQIHRRLDMLVSRQVSFAKQQLDVLARHPMFRRPQAMLDPVKQRLLRLEQQLQAELPRRLALQKQQVESLARHLDSVGPGNVLKRGYSYTLGPDGRVLRHVGDVTGGQQITTVLADGKLQSRVLGDAEQHQADDVDASSAKGTKTPATSTPRKRRRKTTDQDNGPTLFS